jgi:propanol-preferring alcohol dehydrogenase
VKISCCAVCRTDLHIIDGDLPPALRPVIPGHQAVGIVDEAGPGCNTPLGTRVGIAWLRHTCGTCKFCRSGRENLCPNSRYTGYHAHGGYAQYALVPEDFAYRIPDTFTDLQAAPLLCAGIIGYRSLLRANVPPNGKLALIGFGSSAHIILQIALHRGHQTYIVTRGPEHQDFARRLGATWTGGDCADLPEKMDSAILFAPVGTLVPPALAALDNGGTLAIAGIHLTDVPAMNYEQCLFYERDLRSVTSNTRHDGRSLLAESAQAAVHPHIVTYPLEQANQALTDLKSGQIDGTAVLVMPSE